MMIHPVIRVVCFLVLAAFVAFGGVYDLALGFLIILGVILFKRLQSLELSIRIIKRMKWLFLSILVIYLWFTPGDPLFSLPYAGIPTLQGMQTGLLRVASLILIILAVNYFVSAIARNKLVEAIVWLLYPLNWFRIDHKLLALRIALVLELIPKVQHIVLETRQQYESERPGDREEETKQHSRLIFSRVVSVSYLVERLFERVVNEAFNMQPERIPISFQSRPPFMQWLLPLVIAIMFFWLRKL